MPHTFAASPVRRRGRVNGGPNENIMLEPTGVVREGKRCGVVTGGRRCGAVAFYQVGHRGWCERHRELARAAAKRAWTERF